MTPERSRQVYLQLLCERLAVEEMPLDSQDLLALQHFVTPVRCEVTEVVATPATTSTTDDDTTVELTARVPGKATRVNYYMLNPRGLKLLADWRAQQDKLVTVRTRLE